MIGDIPSFWAISQWILIFNLTTLLFNVAKTRWCLPSQYNFYRWYKPFMGGLWHRFTHGAGIPGLVHKWKQRSGGGHQPLKRSDGGNGLNEIGPFSWWWKTDKIVLLKPSWSIYGNFHGDNDKFANDHGKTGGIFKPTHLIWCLGLDTHSDHFWWTCRSVSTKQIPDLYRCVGSIQCFFCHISHHILHKSEY